MKKKVGIIFGCTLLGMLAALYFGLAYYYSSHFFYNTQVGGVSYGNMLPAEAENLRSRADMQYSLKLLGRNGAEATLTAEEIGLQYSYTKTMGQIKQEQNPFLWPIELFSAQDYTADCSVSFDRGLLEDRLAQISFLKEENMTAPQDAYIGGFDETERRYVIVPEVEGTVLVRERFTENIQNAIIDHLEQVDLDAAGCYREPAVREDNAQLTAELSKLNYYTESTVTYTFGDQAEAVDFSVFRDWIEKTEDSISVNMAKAEEYVAALDEKYSTYRKDELFTSVDGYRLKLPKGDFGWKINVEEETLQLAEELMAGTKVSREPVWYSQGASFGESDIGDFYIEVNITDQVVYVLEKGEVIFTSDCVTGNMAKGNDTPAGIYGVTYKARNAVLRGPGYASPVKYWMPFNKGVGLHDASWRGRFGGTIYKTSGSHGCVNLPTKAAATIYDYVYKGCPVVCYYLDERYIVSAPEPEEEEVTATPTPTASPTPAPVIREQEPTLPPQPTQEPVPTIPEGTILQPDGSMLLPNGIILYPDGTAIYPGGYIVYPDGTVVEPAATPAPTAAPAENPVAAETLPEGTE
ncbi:MAG: L,D-transpeptidase family protein [Lachnospiraceae bacterium]|nr:L,D-transpeptidase family protein [Lachnospiraceae bacterium]